MAKRTILDAPGALRTLCGEHDQVVLPQSPEKTTCRLIADCSARAMQNLGDGALAIDRHKQPFLNSVDEERKIRIGVARIDKHGGDAARRAILDGQRPGKPDRNETAPGAVLE